MNGDDGNGNFIPSMANDSAAFRLWLANLQLKQMQTLARLEERVNSVHKPEDCPTTGRVGRLEKWLLGVTAALGSLMGVDKLVDILQK